MLAKPLQSWQVRNTPSPKTATAFFERSKMDLDNAAAFMLGTIGYGVGVIVVLVVIVAINNIIAKYWKPVRIFTADSWRIDAPARFVTQEELDRVAPHMEDTTHGQKETSQKV